MDSVWYHVGFRCRLGILQSTQQTSYHRLKLEIYVSKCEFGFPPPFRCNTYLRSSTQAGIPALIIMVQVLFVPESRE